jgi:hypothetical protein
MVLTGLAVGSYVNPLVALCVFPREDWIVLETQLGTCEALRLTVHGN